MPLLDAAFPAGAELPECARELLEALYPTVRWNEVTFHPVLPGYLLKFTHAAVTLPDPLSVRHIRIFVGEGRWNGGVMTRGLLGLLVHEAYHVLQYQQRLGGIGLGPLRGFVVQYLAAALTQGGGRRNRYEKPAYAQEEAFLRAWDKLATKPCAAGAASDATRSAIAELVRAAPDLVKRRADP